MWLIRRGFLLCAAALAVTGCSDTRVVMTEEAAVSFSRDLAAGDFAAACALLAPATRERVERAGPCATSLAEARLPAGAVRSGVVWGDRAQVRMTNDTVFLVETAHGWKVAAAGCLPRGEAPYDCAVEGP